MNTHTRHPERGPETTNVETKPTPADASGDALEARARAVDDALEQVHNLPTGAVRAALGLKDAVEAFHRDGLVRLVRALRDAPGGVDALVGASEDPFVHTLLTMHGILRPGLDDRLRRAIDVVRPLLHQHGGDVEFVRRDDDVVYVRLHGSCTDCTLAPATLDEAVHEAVRKEAPEIRRIEVVRDADATSTSDEKPMTEHPGEGWEPGPMAHEVPDDRMLRFDVGRRSVVFTRAGGTLRAWRNECPHQGLPIDGGYLEPRDDDGVRLVCPWHGWAFDAADGRCEGIDARLEPLPLIERGGICWVRP